MATSAGAELALLLLNGFHSMTHEVVVELDRRGHPGVRPVHEFALRAVDNGATSASELGRRLAVSKQAAAKTIAALEELGYVERAPDPVDARRKQIRVTARGHELMSIGGALFDDVRAGLSSMPSSNTSTRSSPADPLCPRTSQGTQMLAHRPNAEPTAAGRPPTVSSSADRGS
jgi:hypothetical protein